MFQPLSFACGLLLAATAAQALTIGSTVSLGSTVNLGSTVSLGSAAAGFGVCAATTITNSGNTVVHGPIGLSPGTSITGFPPGVAGSIQIGTPAAVSCESDIHTAYGMCVGLPATKVLSGTPLGGLTLTPGVYKFATTAALNGILTLDGLGSTTSQFVFQIGTTFSTTVGAEILLINGVRACNVFFCVGSSATIGDATHFNGTIIAYTSIGVGTGVVNVGGFFAENGAVTLLTDDITPPGVC